LSSHSNSVVFTLFIILSSSFSLLHTHTWKIKNLQPFSPLDYKLHVYKLVVEIKVWFTKTTMIEGGSMDREWLCVLKSVQVHFALRTLYSDCQSQLCPGLDLKWR
jgi:hypothetical protein